MSSERAGLGLVGAVTTGIMAGTVLAGAVVLTFDHVARRIVESTATQVPAVLAETPSPTRDVGEMAVSLLPKTASARPGTGPRDAGPLTGASPDVPNPTASTRHRRGPGSAGEDPDGTAVRVR